jgi:17beta-estradiol 17-dehydrogenase / very-long-chain 3-oxoacyl-CoA reductase
MFAAFGKAVVAIILFKLVKWLYSTFIRRVNFDVYKAKGEESFVLITGGANGIGLAWARAFAKRGFNLLIIDKNSSRFSKVRQDLEEINAEGRYEFLTSDAIEDCKPDQIRELVDKITQFDIASLVNNVGMILSDPKMLEENSPNEIYNLIQINCTFPTMLTNALIGKLNERAKKNRTAIINMSSVAGHFKWAWNVVYCATKAYMWAFSRSLSVECLQNGIDVLTVNPGYVQTEMSGMKKNLIVCHPDECVEYAMRKMGQEDIIPHWKHTLMYYSTKFASDILVPTKWQLWISARIEAFKMKPQYQSDHNLKKAN